MFQPKSGKESGTGKELPWGRAAVQPHNLRLPLPVSCTREDGAIAAAGDKSSPEIKGK